MKTLVGVWVVYGAAALCGQAVHVVSTQKAEARIPFVGCRLDGQAGPLKAPEGKSKVVPIRAEAAGQLAYYQAEDGLGVLAPRGWHCFGTYGSNGENLYVSPEPISSDEVIFAKHWKGFSAPVIQLSVELGDTSGRFGVARMMARVFPSHRDFVQRVIEEGIEPVSDFPSGPYPKDKLTYHGKELVEFETPAETEGLGTQSRLLKNGDPIRGMAMLVGETPDLVYMAVRCPQGMNDLVPVIVKQAERESRKPDKE